MEYIFEAMLYLGMIGIVLVTILKAFKKGGK